MSLTVQVRGHKKNGSWDDLGERSRDERRTIYNEKRDVLDGIKKDGTPKAVRVGRVTARLDRVSPGVLRLCPECGFEPWKWQTECPRCHAGLQ